MAIRNYYILTEHYLRRDPEHRIGIVLKSLVRLRILIPDDKEYNLRSRLKGLSGFRKYPLDTSAVFFPAPSIIKFEDKGEGLTKVKRARKKSTFLKAPKVR